MRKLLFLLVTQSTLITYGQLSPLTVEKIMRDPKWMGTSPSNLQWTADGKYLLFNWNPEKAAADSLYYITPAVTAPQKTTGAFRNTAIADVQVRYNAQRDQYVYAYENDIYLINIKTGARRRVTKTVALESNPQFSFNDHKIIFTRDQNAWAWDVQTGETTQLTNFITGPATATPAPAFTGRGNQQQAAANRPPAVSNNKQEKWLQQDALENSVVLQRRKQKKDEADSMLKLFREKPLRSIPLDGKNVSMIAASNNGRFISYRLSTIPTGKTAVVPSYVTESGFTEELAARTKVGAPLPTQELFVFDTEKDTVFAVKTDSIPGIRDLPDYLKDYPAVYKERSQHPPLRPVNFLNTNWSPTGDYAMVEVRAQDNKDRWFLLLDGETGQLSLLDRQRDEAWIGGPSTNGFPAFNSGWLNNQTFWFQSETTGYSHLYTINVTTKEKQALTSGNYEVLKTELGPGKKYFYLTTNEVEPGQQQLYRLPVTGGKAERLTTLTGSNLATISPDEKWIAILYSYSNKPWELYLQPNGPVTAKSKPVQITNQAQSEEFKTYNWRDPELITFTARDNAKVYARLMRPAQPDAGKPAVIFVHGAGYLQNAHKWWSSYFREYMFHNLLVDNGYTVLDIDYRGSAGYGRDWRTGIYRYMGGKDLDDIEDGARYLVKEIGINPKHIGVYGGSYGGFITLMALFKKPAIFAAGAALRPVTDWAHYNHGYTSNILNEPFSDSIAYHRSSPINFASGLQDHLLICHGMVDVNVHFQDVVRVTQRLIELGKDNWELSVYPMEDHGFVEPESWTDEYKRIFRLFETWLKK
ncbi:peptidase S9 [Niastella koreensis]|uniref:Peptidase S9 prolyl oligopeptidase active site domain protein n=2 Tax=Niastella koreensis TaxID=354356 RepID=G8TPC5_NIAKG|nr:prolyl oligopeptidase family serine peptidase [Niastella koreensis]AEV96731.1 peptidase S9 prolyl oligopeptidase active site domain protein [Niastella koreensis GR20-10]OQP49090.1 peptidase S9 [Niastella koreensis]